MRRENRWTGWSAPAAALLLLSAALISAPACASEEAAKVEVPEGAARATFAGGCFWCMEPPFDKIDGVLATISGYSGGAEKDPTYKQVSSGRTGHTEVVQVHYDPARVSYEELLDVFWRNIDPLTENRQFCDWGSQYRTAIFFHDEEQGRLAEASKRAIEESGRLEGPIVTEITPFTAFYPAEEYHQDFYKKNPAHYKRYRTGCGRDEALRRIWGEAR